MSDITSTAHNVPDTASEESDTAVDVAAVSAKARKTLFPLLFVYLLGTLAIHAFNLVFHEIGADLDAGASASLITAIPGVVLGIVCFVFGSLGDFISLRRMTVIGIMVLAAGSIGGFLLHGSLLWVRLCSAWCRPWDSKPLALHIWLSWLDTSNRGRNCCGSACLPPPISWERLPVCSSVAGSDRSTGR